jgi:hypothetical protein
MLPEPTIPKPPAAPATLERPWVMTPLFCAPGGANPAPPATRRTGTARRPSRRASARSQAGQGNRNLVAVRPGTRDDPADLLAINGERLQRALWRSFLRYGVAGDPDAAVHAAMNVIEPVLAARDTEILRLRKTRAPRGPRR